jgi:hypothetical protein
VRSHCARRAVHQVWEAVSGDGATLSRRRYRGVRGPVGVTNERHGGGCRRVAGGWRERRAQRIRGRGSARRVKNDGRAAENTTYAIP